MADADLAQDFPPTEDPAVLERAVTRQQAVLNELGTARGGEADRARATALWRMGDALFRLRRMSEAAQRFEEAERAFSGVADSDLLVAGARLGRAGALLALKRYPPAGELAESVLAYGRRAHRSYFIRAGSFIAAVAFKGAGRWQNAAASATTFLDDVGPNPPAKELPRVATTLVIRATTERLYGRPEEALDLLERAMPLAAEGDDREELYQAMNERAASLYSAGRPVEATAAFDEIIAQFRGGSEEFAPVAVWGSRVWKLRIRLRPHTPPRPRT